MVHFFYLITLTVIRFLCEKFLTSSGGIAQLGEHLPCKQGVSGSIPLTSTNNSIRIVPAQRKFNGNIAQLVRAHA